MWLQLAAAFSVTPIAVADPSPTMRQLLVEGPEALRLGSVLESKGESRAAEKLYRALLGDPSSNIRNEARFRLARLLGTRNALKESATLLRRILDEQPTIIAVRIELARTLERMGDDAGALRQLRAAQAGKPSASIARQIDRYASTLRDRRTFGGELKAAIAPDSNINRGTSQEQLQTIIGEFNINRDGRATSGLGLAVEGSALARHWASPRTAIYVQANGRSVSYKQSRFSRTGLAVRAGVQSSSQRNTFSAAIVEQQHAIGGTLYLRTIGIEAGLTRRLTPTMQGRLSVGTSRLTIPRNELETGTLHSANAAVDVAVSPVRTVSLSVSASRRQAKDRAYSSKSFQIAVVGWQDVGRVTIEGSATVGRLQADRRLNLLPDARRDLNVAAGLGITSRHITVSGLSPSLRFFVERNRSSIAFYDNTRRNLELALSRSF